MLTIGVTSSGAPDTVRKECQDLANRLQVTVSTTLWPEHRDANTDPIGLFEAHPEPSAYPCDCTGEMWPHGLPVCPHCGGVVNQ